MLVNCVAAVAGFAVVMFNTAFLLSGMVTKEVVGVLLLLLVLVAGKSRLSAGVGVGVAALTCTGRLNVCIKSGDCWIGEVAVWAVFCFSRFRHLARLF